jgi:uncharacterized protein YjbI with pentapeptide repeats
LHDVNFTAANIQGTNFNLGNWLEGSGNSLAQLYSTASFQHHDLSGIGLYGNNLSGANFAGQNLTGADFTIATLTDADFTGADVRGTRFDSYFGGPAVSLAQLYSTASYKARDLSRISMRDNNLSGANFAGQNLADADFNGAILTQTDFTGADVRGAHFDRYIFLDDQTGQFAFRGTGIAPAQLYSTASYKTNDLRGISVPSHNFDGANFAGQNLSGANFKYSALTGAIFSQANLQNVTFNWAELIGANFTGADIRGANFERIYDDITRKFVGGISLAQLYSTASYTERDLSGITVTSNNLGGANFASQNLSHVNFAGATLTGADFRQSNLQNVRLDSAILTGADFTGADVRGASSAPHCANTRALICGISLAQLYSTASYQAYDLSRISLHYHLLRGGNFAGQNLANAAFDSATLTDANFHEANLAGAVFYGATLTGTNFSAADARGASLAPPTSATTTNLIWPDGHVDGLVLNAGGRLLVRDYDGDSRYGLALSPIPIRIETQMAMGPGGVLRLIFEADDWNSTISFAPETPVALGGTLELTFADSVELASQIGRTFDLFDWTGVNPTGAFSVFSPYDWDLTNLYTTGEVKLTAIPEPANVTFIVILVARMCLLRLRPTIKG